jgi:hypothetical protein
MNKGHLNSGEAINLGNLGKDMDVGASYALIKTEAMEVIRMVVPKGKSWPNTAWKGK